MLNWLSHSLSHCMFWHNIKHNPRHAIANKGPLTKQDLTTIFVTTKRNGSNFACKSAIFIWQDIQFTFHRKGILARVKDGEFLLTWFGSVFNIPYLPSWTTDFSRYHLLLVLFCKSFNDCQCHAIVPLSITIVAITDYSCQRSKAIS